jgi:methyl-accepting chemotaxis protein
MHEQDLAVKDVGQAVGALEDSTQQSAAAAQQLAATAQEMAAQATALESLIEFFRLASPVAAHPLAATTNGRG